MGALNYIGQQLKRLADSQVGTAVIPVELGAARLASTGGPIAVFADSTNNPSVVGCQVTDSETWSLRFNNAATFTGFAANVHLPSDISTAYPITVNIVASKVGATVGDAVTFTIGAFITAVGALHDADADCGGVSSAMTGNAATKTKQLCTRAIAASDIAASLASGGPGQLALSIAPTAGTLGTDDLVVHDVYLTYTRRSV